MMGGGRWIGAMAALAAAVLIGLGGTARALPVDHTAGGCADAGFCTLAELTGGKTITIADKTYDNWSIFSDIGSVPAPASDIRVTGSVIDPANQSLEFVVVNDALKITGIEDFDFNIGFKVSVIGGAARIKDAGIELGGRSFTNADSGAIILSEDIVGEGALSVFEDHDPTFGGTQTSDSTIFSVKSAIDATLNVQIVGDVTSDVVQLDNWTMTFSQTVPTPGTLALLAGGLVGAGALRRRRKRG